jgi:hypothetical protein
MHKRVLVLAAALVAALAAASPANADRDYNNWHIHSGLTELGGLHRSAAFFPAILGVDLATYKATSSLWAYCPDATDKPLVGGDGGSKSGAGVCMNETTIIHILTMPAGQPPPEGWLPIPGTSTGYYKLSASGQPIEREN